MFGCLVLKWLITVCSSKKLAIFTTNADAENQSLINHKCVCVALNRQFFVGAVMPSFSFFRHICCRNILLSLTRPEKSLHFLVKSPDTNLHFLVSPEIALHLITG